MNFQFLITKLKKIFFTFLNMLVANITLLTWMKILYFPGIQAIRYSKHRKVISGPQRKLKHLGRKCKSKFEVFSEDMIVNQNNFPQ